MSIEVHVPALPESVADATILSWHKQPGDPVNRDETIVDLETDKVVLEVPAPDDGILDKIAANNGDTVQAGDLLAVVNVEPATGDARTTEKQPGAEKISAAPDPAPDPDSADADPVLTPAVRRLIKEMKIDPDEITGTGKDGRIQKSDVLAYMDTQSTKEQKAALAETPTPVSIQEISTQERPEQRVPMTRLRSRIAERLLQAQQNAAILTTFNEIDLHAADTLRKRYRDSFEKQHGAKLGYMSFFVKATVEALKQFPVVNASIDGQDIIYHGYYDIGIAVGSAKGLVVPILRDADQLSYAEVEKSIKAFGVKANEASLTYEELTGGTFTITNGGVFGSMLSTPILNPPQSAILGMHNIQQRPVVREGEIVVRPMMYVALSYDHRIIDGRDAVRFLVTIKEMLEDPARLLLQV